jgi:NAD dependent epimerase/dehydratase family enzyme
VGATIVVDGHCVLPTRTVATGYAFKYPTIDGACAAIATG